MLKVHVLLAIALYISACAPSESALHFSLPELGSARSMILLIEDELHSSPFVVRTDLPFAPIDIDASLVSLDAAKIEVALYTCPLQGLGLVAGQGRPRARTPAEPKPFRPAAVYRSMTEDGRVLPYVREPSGATADAIEAVNLEVDPARACPKAEVTRLSVDRERGRISLLAPLSNGRAVLVFSDRSQSVLDASGFVPLEGELENTRIVAAHRLPDGRSIVVGEGGRPVWMGSIESGFERQADMVGVEPTQIFLAPFRDAAAPFEVFALRSSSVERFDGREWVVTSTHTPFPDALNRERGIAWSGPGEALFIIPADEKGAYRSEHAQVEREQVVPNALDEQTSMVAAHQVFGTVVGVSDTSLWRKEAASGWTPITAVMRRGHPRMAFAVGRALVFSDNQGTLHNVDPVAEGTCPELSLAQDALGMVAPLSDELFAIATEPNRLPPTLALVRYRDLSPLCDLPIDP